MPQLKPLCLLPIQDVGCMYRKVELQLKHFTRKGRPLGEMRRRRRSLTHVAKLVRSARRTHGSNTAFSEDYFG